MLVAVEDVVVVVVVGCFSFLTKQMMEVLERELADRHDVLRSVT